MQDSEKIIFENLALKHMDSLYSKAIRLVKNTEQAEALVQQCYAIAYTGFEHFDKNLDFDKWLTAILMIAYANFCTQSENQATI